MLLESVSPIHSNINIPAIGHLPFTHRLATDQITPAQHKLLRTREEQRHSHE